MTNTRIKGGAKEACRRREDNGWLRYSEKKVEAGSGGNREVTPPLSNYEDE